MSNGNTVQTERRESAYRTTQMGMHVFHIKHVILGIIINTCSIIESLLHVTPYTILLVTQAFHIHL